MLDEIHNSKHLAYETLDPADVEEALAFDYFHFAPSRAHKHVEAFLGDFRGTRP